MGSPGARGGATLLDLGGRRLVLASASPRRAQLLESIGLDFEVAPADIDESPLPAESPSGYVARLSQRKAAEVGATAGDAIVVAADTTVDVDGQILEKPLDDDDLRRMLRMLSGRTHHVHTGVTVIAPGQVSRGAGGGGTRVVTTAVTFVDLTGRDIDWYVSTGEAADKAGGYAIQGAAAVFVERVDGSVTNVIGLPLAETLALLSSLLGS